MIDYRKEKAVADFFFYESFNSEAGLSCHELPLPCISVFADM